MRLNLLMTGVGGQGIIMASDIVSEAALSAGFDTKKTDAIGMSQRGGSVVSHIRIADKVWSPLIKEGEVDIIIAFEKLEAARWVTYLRPEGMTIVNDQAIPPLAVSTGKEHYPTDAEITDILKQRTGHIYFMHGFERATEIGDVRSLNIYLLGCLSALTPEITNEFWEKTIREHLPPKVHTMNLAAFTQGKKDMQDANS